MTQIQIRYEPVEDRLLLALGLGERVLGFWLTRRATALLWQMLWRRLGASLDVGVGGAAKAWLLQLRQDEARQTQALISAPRLAPDAAPMLIQSMEFGRHAGGGHALQLSDGAGRNERMRLDDASLYALIRVIEEAHPKTGWQLDLWRPAAPDSQRPAAALALH